MIIGKIHPGSGLGDQLFSYIITRVIALDKGYDFGFIGKEFFKGKEFMNLDWGMEVNFHYKYKILEPNGELFITWPLDNNIFKFDKPYYDPEVNFIEDGTIIDGTGAQDERYWGHRLDEIREWLKVEPLEIDRDCIINIRGGEYRTVPELILPNNYWGQAMTKLDLITYQIHTDDIEYAQEIFGKTADIIQNIALNWRAVRYAKNLILSNSAFGILPALLNENVKEVIAPRYWAGRNVGEWRRSQNYYKKFTYI